MTYFFTADTHFGSEEIFSVPEIKRLLQEKTLYLDTDPDAWSM